MDERLEAGRHHLGNGDRALREGYLDDSRSHFEAALLQFRGPELRLGEAHALRGLAHVEVGLGNIAQAERTVRAAIRHYQSVRDQLDRVDPDGVSVELGRDAEVGEGAALVLLGDLLLRQGRTNEVRETLHYAREIYAGVGDVPSAAAVWLALGRMSVRTGRLDQARDALERSLQIYDRSGDLVGQSAALLVCAEVERLDGKSDVAEAQLQLALESARKARSAIQEGRVKSHLAAFLLEQGRHEDAGDRWSEALTHIREAGDVEMEGFALIGLGEVLSRVGHRDAMDYLHEGATLLGSLEHHHGMGSAMLQVAHHALRIHQPLLALAAAESARQLWTRPDPVRGVGKALRLIVKALAALRQWPAVLSAAHLRVAVAGEAQPNALEVRDFYRAKSSERVLADLDAQSPDQLLSRTEALLELLLTPVLEPMDMDPFSLATAGGALAIVDAVVNSATAVPDSGRVSSPADVEGTAVDLPSRAEDYAGMYTAPADLSEDRTSDNSEE